MTELEKRCLIATFEQYEGDGDPPHYESDLGATMRAARRLLLDTVAHAEQQIVKCPASAILDAVHDALHENRDPARAAYECLLAFLMEKRG